MWEMSTAGMTCAYYYTYAGTAYSDAAIEKHTHMMLLRITSQIRVQHPEYGTDWRLTYIVTRDVGASVI